MKNTSTMVPMEKGSPRMKLALKVMPVAVALCVATCPSLWRKGCSGFPYLRFEMIINGARPAMNPRLRGIRSRILGRCSIMSISSRGGYRYKAASLVQMARAPPKPEASR